MAAIVADDGQLSDAAMPGATGETEVEISAQEEEEGEDRAGQRPLIVGLLQPILSAALPTLYVGGIDAIQPAADNGKQVWFRRGRSSQTI